jgi:copper chaperone
MVKLKVTGMSCNHCVMAVTQALKAVPGVKKADVDLRKGEATVEGAALPNDLIKAVVEEGFEADEIST